MKMSGSSQQPPPQRQQQQEQLLGQALSHGSYLWSGRDVENALMWFHSTSSASASSADDGERTAGAGDEENVDDIDAEAEGCTFLRLLLHARGIMTPRPALEIKSQRLTNNNKKRKSKTKRKSHTPSVLEEVNPEKVGRKRPRKMMVADSIEEDRASPLQSIIMGYYQLFLSPTQSASTTTTTAHGHSQSSKGTGTNEKDEDNIAKFGAPAIKKAEKASSKLLDDLSSIILARRHTNEIYQASLNDINREDVNLLAKKFDRAPDNDVVSMSKIIDEYMTHPTTCARMVYASSLFDRLLDLCGTGDQKAISTVDNVDSDGIADNISGSNGNINNNPALRRYLQKLFGLARTNVKIQKVVLLLLLEPLRRLQLQMTRKGGDQNQPKRPNQLQTIKEDHSQHFRKPCQNEQQSPDMELSPLLTSSSFWSNVSAETIEKACSRPPLSALVQFILQTSPSTKLSNDDDGNSNLAYSTISTAVAAADKHDNAQTILWWTLPSPLLCAVSQLHFPIAGEYIRYWISQSVLGHEQLYNNSTQPAITESDTEHHSIHSSSKQQSGAEESLFQRAIQRIKEINSTSDRLNQFCSHILHSMEKESRELYEVCLLEENENIAFQKELAFRAIRRAVFL